MNNIKKNILLLILLLSIPYFLSARTFSKTIKKEKFTYFDTLSTNSFFIIYPKTLISEIQTNLCFLHFGKIQKNSKQNSEIYTPLGTIFLKQGKAEIRFQNHILEITADGDAEFHYNSRNLKLPNRKIYFFINQKTISYVLDKEKISDSFEPDTFLRMLKQNITENNQKQIIYKNQIRSLQVVIKQKNKETAKYKELIKKNPSYKEKIRTAESQIKSLQLSLSQFQKRLRLIDRTNHFYKNELLSLKYFKKYFKIHYNTKLFKKILQILKEK